MKRKAVFYRTESGHEPLREWLKSLSKAHRREIGILIFMLQSLGPDLRMPHSKSLGKGLHELRVKCADAAYRIFYGFVGNQIILLLHGFVKKTQKTPQNDLELARERLAKYLARE